MDSEDRRLEPVIGESYWNRMRCSIIGCNWPSVCYYFGSLRCICHMPKTDRGTIIPEQKSFVDGMERLWEENKKKWEERR
jgi:hypothetical protein